VISLEFADRTDGHSQSRISRPCRLRPVSSRTSVLLAPSSARSEAGVCPQSGQSPEQAAGAATARRSAADARSRDRRRGARRRAKPSLGEGSCAEHRVRVGGSAAASACGRRLALGEVDRQQGVAGVSRGADDAVGIHDRGRAVDVAFAMTTGPAPHGHGFTDPHGMVERDRELGEGRE
jgi:hypothetical protein